MIKVKNWKGEKQSSKWRKTVILQNLERYCHQKDVQRENRDEEESSQTIIDNECG